MRTIASALLLATLVAGCSKSKSKSDESPPPAPTGASSASSSNSAVKPEDKPEPVAKEAAKAPAGDVRAPVAADLAEYTKDIAGSGPLIATIDTSMGAFHCELFADKAPITVANFVGLATGKKPWRNLKTGGVETNKPYYDGLIFHRVIPSFMIQGGDQLGVGRGDAGYKFEDEVNNGLTMKPGTLAMANAGPGTNGSQFFITEDAPAHLNNRHTIFGQCKEVDLVVKIENVPVGPGNRPNTPVTINKITFARG